MCVYIYIYIYTYVPNMAFLRGRAYSRPPVNTPTPSTTTNKTMLRPMSLMHI